jgi:hypothetical protein
MLWPTHNAAVVVLRPVTPERLGRAVKQFARRVGRNPASIALTSQGVIQLLRGMPSQGRTYVVDGEDVGGMTVRLKGSRRPTRILLDRDLPTGWVLLKR